MFLSLFNFIDLYLVSTSEIEYDLMHFNQKINDALRIAFSKWKEWNNSLVPHGLFLFVNLTVLGNQIELGCLHCNSNLMNEWITVNVGVVKLTS